MLQGEAEAVGEEGDGDDGETVDNAVDVLAAATEEARERTADETPWSGECAEPHTEPLQPRW